MYWEERRLEDIVGERDDEVRWEEGKWCGRKEEGRVVEKVHGKYK